MERFLIFDNVVEFTNLIPSLLVCPERLARVSRVIFRDWGTLGHTPGMFIDGRTTRHLGYAVSVRRRKRIEEIFGWLKTVGLLRKARHRGAARVGWMFTFGLAVYNLVRLRRLAALPT